MTTEPKHDKCYLVPLQSSFKRCIKIISTTDCPIFKAALKLYLAWLAFLSLPFRQKGRGIGSEFENDLIRILSDIQIDLFPPKKFEDWTKKGEVPFVKGGGAQLKVFQSIC